MTPEVTVSDVKKVYQNATFQDPQGVDITDTSNPIGTGGKVIIDGTMYVAIKLGDVTGDGKLKASDYVLIKNHIMNDTSFSDLQSLAADVNKDGAIKASDYVLIKNYIMNGTKISL